MVVIYLELLAINSYELRLMKLLSSTCASVRFVCTNIPKSTGVIRWVSNMMPNNVLQSVRDVLIISHIIYAKSARVFPYLTALMCLKPLVKEALSMQNVPPKRFVCYFFQYDHVDKYFLCELIKVVCYDKLLYFVSGMDQYSMALNY